MSVEARPFRPAFGLAHPHAQTIFGFLARPRHLPPLRRERWETPDGDFVDVDRLAAPSATEGSAPHLLVLHGLEGSSRSGYVRATLREAHARQWAATALNFRSCSGEPNRVARSYSSGDTADARWVLAQLRTRGATGPLLAIGFSLGANVLLKLLAEDGEVSPLSAAAAISPPLDLSRSASALDTARGVRSIYRRSFLRTMKHKALAKALRHPTELDYAAIERVRTLESFDDHVTAPLGGFRDAQDYYRQSSAGPLLGRIRCRTLVLISSDDPIVSRIPLEDAAANPALTLCVTERGGHVGFVAGWPWRPVFWAERTAANFCQSQLHLAYRAPPVQRGSKDRHNGG